MTLGATGVVEAWRHPPRGGAWARGPQAAHTPPTCGRADVTTSPFLWLGNPWPRVCGQVSLETKSLGSPAAHLELRGPTQGTQTSGSPVPTPCRTSGLGYREVAGSSLPCQTASCPPSPQGGEGVWELLWDAPLSPQPFHSPGWWATPASDLVALLVKTTLFHTQNPLSNHSTLQVSRPDVHLCFILFIP